MSVRSLWLAVALTACAIPDTQFEPTAGTEPGPGAPPSIIASATAIEVLEAMDGTVMISLSKAPTEPLRVSAATLSKKLALSTPELVFTAETFAQPQALVITGLADADAEKDTAEITLSAPGSDSLAIAATVRDDDTLALVTDVGATGVVAIDEGGSSEVRVRLAAQPLGDVTVSAQVGAGPVTVSPTSLVFSAQSYDTEQVLTFSAADDANVTTEDIALTLRAMGLADKGATLRAIDDDTLNLVVNPSSLQVTEQGTPGSVAVSLTQQPSANVTVTLSTATGKVALDRTQLVFTPGNYASPQAVAVSAPDDDDVADGAETIVVKASGLTDRTTSVTIRDNDTQALVSDASPPVVVAENSTSTFNLTLRYRPSADVVVAVSSLAPAVATVTPGVLRFTPADYAMPHPVTVKGTDDNDLAGGTTSVRFTEASLAPLEVAVSVTDDDTQRFVLSATSVNVPEGGNRTFDVSLAYQPASGVSCTVTSSNPAALPVSPATLSFSVAGYATPQRITVSAPIDTNNVSEMADIKIEGCGAPVPATVMAMVADATVLVQYGWPMPFTATSNVSQGVVLAYKIKVEVTSRLDSFGVYVPAAVGDFRMALYSNGNNQPDALIAQMPVRRALVNGSNTADIPDVDVPVGDYWVVLRVGQLTAVGYAPAGVVGAQCTRNLDIPSLNDPWPVSFGGATCNTAARLYNLWINNTYQP